MSNVLVHVPQELFAPAESLHFEGVFDLPMLKAGPDLYTFDEPLVWSADLTNTGEAILVEGTVEGDGHTACGRCGEPAIVPLFGDVEGYFLIDASEEQDPELEEDDFDILPESHDIDLGELMLQALLIDVPFIPLCTDDCKGLCPKCGANLNESPCDCVVEENPIDEMNPFAVLQGFIVDDDADKGADACCAFEVQDEDAADDDEFFDDDEEDLTDIDDADWDNWEEWTAEK